MYNLVASQVAEMSKSSHTRNIQPKFGIAAALIATLFLISGCTPPESDTGETGESSQTSVLTDDISKASYGMGYGLGDNIKSQQADMLNYDAFLLGAKDSLSGIEKQVSEDELKLAFEAFQTASLEKQNQANEKIMEEGRKFLAEVAARENVVSLESGMLYEVMVAGDGPKPVATDQVRTHYHGTLIDGTVFDSSVERGQPATFPVNGVIQGWVEALQLMSVGSKWRLFIPADLAYGDQGAGGLIGPGATLVFEVELLEIVAQE